MHDNNIPVGMMQNDELYNLLTSLALTGTADIYTLYLVARGAGISNSFASFLRGSANARDEIRRIEQQFLTETVNNVEGASRRTLTQAEVKLLGGLR